MLECRAEVSPECRRSSETSFKKPRCRQEKEIVNTFDHHKRDANLHSRQNFERTVASKMRDERGWHDGVCSQDVHG
jgi:hypothetical protein